MFMREVISFLLSNKFQESVYLQVSHQNHDLDCERNWGNWKNKEDRHDPYVIVSRYLVTFLFKSTVPASDNYITSLNYFGQT